MSQAITKDMVQDVLPTIFTLSPADFLTEFDVYGL